MSRGTAPPTPARRSAPVTVIAALLALLAVPAAAQYRDAGTDVDILPSQRELLERAVEEARWRLGRVRIAPWIGVRDVSYVRGERRAEGAAEDGDDDGDLTATVGAGLRLYLPLGQAVLAAHALPEYAWWQEQDERNTAVGRYGVGLFGFFNRLETEVTARRVEDVGFLSSDLLVRQPLRSDTAMAQVQLRLGAATALFASGEVSEVRVEDPRGLQPEETSELLDRDTTAWRGGVRYLLRGDRGHLGAGVQEEETEFLGTADARSNEGSGWYVEALVRGNRMSLSVDYAERELEATAGSSFPGYSRGTGSAVLAFHRGHRLRTSFYGRRDLRYSALAAQRYFEEERVGASVALQLGRGNVIAFYEEGDDAFFGAGASTPSEDVAAWGATYHLPLGEYLDLRLGTRRTTFEPAGGPRREVREVMGGLTLTLGSDLGEW